MNHIDTTIDIDASAATVWAALTDFDAYEEWNPRSRITGVAAEGERLVVAPGPEAQKMPTFRPRVLAAGPTESTAGDDERATFELRWLGHLWVRGLFDGEHSFRVESLDENRSRLTQSESFSGVLAGLLLRRYGADTEDGFRAVNEALKARAEELAAGAPGDAPGATDAQSATDAPAA
jgi:hypothetical protein